MPRTWLARECTWPGVRTKGMKALLTRCVPYSNLHRLSIYHQFLGAERCGLRRRLAIMKLICGPSRADTSFADPP